MPCLYTQRTFLPEGRYHVFNRSINRRKVFRKPKDYLFFIRKIQKMLLADANRIADKSGQLNSEALEIWVVSLLSNHFHLIAVENEEHALSRFMASLLKSYWHHLNRKYRWKGSIFYRPFRAKPLVTEIQFREAYDYVCWNAIDAGEGITWINLRYPHPAMLFNKGKKLKIPASGIISGTPRSC
jgi:REP element-mobilizing transposase RayT